MTRTAFVEQNRDAPGTGRNLVQHTDQLAEHLVGLARNPRDVAARLGETRNKSITDRVADGHHHDGIVFVARCAARVVSGLPTTITSTRCATNSPATRST